MALNKIPEKFHVGETVTFWQGVKRSSVKVTTVEGNEITVIDRLGQEMKFKASKTNSTYVATTGGGFLRRRAEHARPYLYPLRAPKAKDLRISSLPTELPKKKAQTQTGIFYRIKRGFHAAWEIIFNILMFIVGIILRILSRIVRILWFFTPGGGF
jgi:hypothetical protein